MSPADIAMDWPMVTVHSPTGVYELMVTGTDSGYILWLRGKKVAFVHEEGDEVEGEMVLKLLQAARKYCDELKERPR